MAIKHKILTENGKLKEVVLTRTKAIKIHCTQCCGYGEVHPKDCDIEDCPLFPFRGKSNIIYDRNIKS